VERKEPEDPHEDKHDRKRPKQIQHLLTLHSAAWWLGAAQRTRHNARSVPGRAPGRRAEKWGGARNPSASRKDTDASHDRPADLGVSEPRGGRPCVWAHVVAVYMVSLLVGDAARRR
jgi:hypothetical protein